MATQISKVVLKKAKRNAVVAVREEFKGKDLVNLREFMNEGDDGYSPTKAGFTIPAENFAEFVKSLRKFGKAAGLLGKTGDDDFEIKSLDDLDDSDNILIAGQKKKESKEEKKAKRTGIVRQKRDLPQDDEPKIVRREKKEEPKHLKRDKKEDADSGDAFNIKAFKKAIKTAVKSGDSADAAEVLKMYKGSKKKLEDVLPKHAVNALNKSLANKKDDALLEKAVAACQKHIIEKDFTM